MSTKPVLQPSPRINVNMTPESFGELKKLADEAGLDMSQFVRNSIRVYGVLRREINKNERQVYIGKDNKIDKEVIIP